MGVNEDEREDMRWIIGGIALSVLLAIYVWVRL